jgi:hypothetical protein
MPGTLTEFSNIIILRDTSETRYAFGTPIDENAMLTANHNALSSDINPFYKKLYGEPNQGSGWRGGYPDISAIIQPNFNYDTITDEGTRRAYEKWTKAIRNNILQAMTPTEESISNGYNRASEDSGTGIIVNNKFYVGKTSTAQYTSITADATDVTVSGVTGISSLTNGSKVILSEVGTTGLETTTVYYAYNFSSGSFKLSNNSSSYTAITNLSGSAGSGEASIAPSTFTYVANTTFVSPSTSLGVGDFIFWGEDPASLNIGGKIAEVYAVGSTDYNAGARYRFEKNTKDAFPLDENDVPVPQNIYYYRKGWNGKGIKNNVQTSPTEIGGGFYVLIKVETNASNQRVIYPYLGADNLGDNSSDLKIIDTTPSTNKYAFTDLIRVRRISNRFNSDQTFETFNSNEIIPCTIHRTSSFYYDSRDDINNNGTLINLFGNTTFPDITPNWIAYYVNPYGGSGSKLEKNSTYVLEINERLPAVELFNKEDFYNFGFKGAI